MNRPRETGKLEKEIAGGTFLQRMVSSSLNCLKNYFGKSDSQTYSDKPLDQVEIAETKAKIDSETYAGLFNAYSRSQHRQNGNNGARPRS